jgi:3-hydroxyisobutyrate dehydrogenase-like beta-hydroxyacid dehydrogenase
MTALDVGFIGLGNMGGALASNLVQAGHRVLAYDIAGPERTPPGAVTASSIDEIAAHTVVVVLSLPDGAASTDVAVRLRKASDRRTTHVGALVTDLWERFADSAPGADFTRIFPFIEGG